MSPADNSAWPASLAVRFYCYQTKVKAKIAAAGERKIGHKPGNLGCRQHRRADQSAACAVVGFSFHGMKTDKHSTTLHCLADSCLRFLVRAPLHRISCFFRKRKAFVSNIGNL